MWNNAILDKTLILSSIALVPYLASYDSAEWLFGTHYALAMNVCYLQTRYYRPEDPTSSEIVSTAPEILDSCCPVSSICPVCRRSCPASIFRVLCNRKCQNMIQLVHTLHNKETRLKNIDFVPRNLMSKTPGGCWTYPNPTAYWISSGRWQYGKFYCADFATDFADYDHSQSRTEMVYLRCCLCVRRA